MNRTDFVQLVLQKAGLEPAFLPPTNIWWYNSLNPQSFRLTRQFYEFIRKRTDIETHVCEVTADLVPKTLLQLEKHFKYPYYIKSKNEIVLLSQDHVVWLTLYGNDLQKYLDAMSGAD